MFPFRKFFFFTLIGVVFSKTIRSRILTNENGTRELVFAENSGLKQEEIDFLLKNLNISKEAFRETSPSPAAAKSVNGTETELSESILMNHWNALTEVGWRNFNTPDHGKTLINNTRVLTIEHDENGEEVEKAKDRQEDGKGDEDSLSENDTGVKTAKRKPRDDTEKPSATISDLCEAIIDLCQIVQPQTNREDLVRCLTLKNETLLHWVEKKLNEEGDSFECSASRVSQGDDEPPEGRTEDETETATISTLEYDEESNSTSRSILRPRRLLHTVLLPLLALLVIKYLVTLPFVAMSVFTMNAMWLGLLSIGAVALAKLKGQDRIFHKFPTRRYNHIHGGEVFESGEPLPTSEIYWSPFRVPLMQSSVNAQ